MGDVPGPRKITMSLSKAVSDDYIRYNVMVLGCVSSGKSTFINSIFKKTVAQTSMVRTTMLPFRYEVRPVSDE